MSELNETPRYSPPKPSIYVCARCTHMRAVHSQGYGRCYGGGTGAAWCKCLSYDGPQPPR